MTELVVTIGFRQTVVCILVTIEIDVDPEHMQYLEQFPLPRTGTGALAASCLVRSGAMLCSGAFDVVSGEDRCETGAVPQL